MDDVTLVKRLALIRHTYQTGVRQSKSPSPYGAMSLLPFHDSLEWFLITACDYLAVDVPASERLLDYFDRLSQKNSDIVGKSSLRKCVEARRGLKHRLIIPDDSPVQEICISTGIFLSDNSLYLFGVDFENTNLVDGIQSQKIREQLKNAVRFKTQGNFDLCMQQARTAYHSILQIYQLNLIPGWYHTCGIHPYRLFCFNRLAFIGGPYPEQQEIAFEEGCAFCCDFLVEAIIKIEQTMSRGDLTDFQGLLHELDRREAALRRSEP
jgi:hypothetical protein